MRRASVVPDHRALFESPVKQKPDRGLMQELLLAGSRSENDRSEKIVPRVGSFLSRAPARERLSGRTLAESSC